MYNFALILVLTVLVKESVSLGCTPNFFMSLHANTTCSWDTFDGSTVMVASPYVFSSAQTIINVSYGFYWQVVTINSSYPYPRILVQDYEEAVVNVSNLAHVDHLNRVLMVAMFVPLPGAAYVFHWPIGNESTFNSGVLIAQTGPGYYFVSLRVEKKDTLAYLWGYGSNPDRALCLMCTGTPRGFEAIPDSHFSTVLADPGSIALANISPYYADAGYKYITASLIEL
jgi:hypothetical protein